MALIAEPLTTFLTAQNVEASLLAAVSGPSIKTVSTPNLDTVLSALYIAPGELAPEAVAFMNRIGDVTRLRAEHFQDSRHAATAISDKPLTTPEAIEVALSRFSYDRLHVDHNLARPYHLPSEEVDPLQSFDVMNHRERVFHRRLSDEGLRDPNTRVLWSLAPHEDYTRTIEYGGRTFVQRGYGFFEAMTFVNPDPLQVTGYPPSYALAMLEAAMPTEQRGRFRYIEPDTVADFKTAIDEQRPQVVMLSGIGMNTRTLVGMSAYARERGALEVWLGNYAATGPYPILGTAFDRLFWGLGETYQLKMFTGHTLARRSVPPPERLISRVRVPANEDGTKYREYNILNLPTRLGCPQPCGYCAERKFSGGLQDPLLLEELKACVKAAHEKHGVWHVYFSDPSFGLGWKNDQDVEAQLIQYIRSLGMTFSVLTEAQVIKDHGQFMVDHGLKKAFLGLESFSDVAQTGRLTVLGRNRQKIEENIRTVLWLRERGVEVTGLTMLGIPGETIEQMTAGVDILAQLVSNSQISTNIPFAGTDFFVEGVLRGWIHNFDPDEGLVYGFSPWAAGGLLHDPLALRQKWVEAHLRVNDITRPGGLLDRTHFDAPALARKFGLDYPISL